MNTKVIRIKRIRCKFQKWGVLAATAALMLAGFGNVYAGGTKAVEGKMTFGITNMQGMASGGENLTRTLNTEIDFRYSPKMWQSTYCFPDEPYKSLVGERGDLRYGHPGTGHGIHYFPITVEFSLNGMEKDRIIWQRLESPEIPIIHTRIERDEAYMELTTFATNRKGEGRVDNVLVEIWPISKKELHAVPALTIKTKREVNIHVIHGSLQVPYCILVGNIF